MIKEITSAQNSLVKHLVRLRQNSDYRHEHQTVLVTGKKMVEELPSAYPVRNVLATEEFDLHSLSKLQAKEVFYTTEEILQKITGLSHTEGIAAEVDLPKESTLEGLHKIVTLDGLNDPGNVGTILRTAIALGWDGIFLLNHCCDPFNDKALRAAKGATFRIPIRTGTLADLKEIIQKNRLKPIAADLTGQDAATFGETSHLLLVLGNEAHGLSEEVQQLCQKITIPIENMESLNVSVAAAIIMYQLRESR